MRHGGISAAADPGAWLGFVLPALALNYLGLGAMCCGCGALENPLPPSPGLVQPAAGAAGHGGPHHRQQAMISGAYTIARMRAARLHPAHAGAAHLRDRRKADYMPQ